MARGTKKEGQGSTAVIDPDTDPEAAERARLKGLAFSRNVLSQKPVRLAPSAALTPSKTLIKHHGKDILRKSHRKNRYLFSFPALLAPISGGKIGDLKDLGTKNPILYLDFPQGQMKLFGTIVYPKNRYLTLQFSKGGKNVICDDYFDNMIVFSDAWWIGKKEDNPEELQLQFPTELNVGKPEGHDFRGGVGTACVGNPGLGRLTENYTEQVSPKVSPENHSTDDSVDYKELVEVTPTRHSARTAGKAFNFAEGSSGDDIIVDGYETPETEDEKYETETRAERKSSRPVVFEIDNEDNAILASGIPEDPLDRSHTPLVQTTLSSLFKKVEEKKTKNDVKQKKSTSEASKLMKGKKKTGERESGCLPTIMNFPFIFYLISAVWCIGAYNFVVSVTVYQRKSKRTSSTKSSKKGNRDDLVVTPQSSDPIDSTHVEDDDIEEFSSSSQDVDASDEDWNA